MKIITVKTTAKSTPLFKFLMDQNFHMQYHSFSYKRSMIIFILQMGKLRLRENNDFLKVIKFGSNKVRIAQVYLALQPESFQYKTKPLHNKGPLENKNYRDNVSLGIMTIYLGCKHGFIIQHTAFKSNTRKTTCRALIF